MNIFVTHASPFVSAAALDDVRSRKMLLESVQMLCTAIRSLDDKPPDWCYKSMNPNHPCNIWVRSNPRNFMWLYLHACGLHRRNPNHKSGKLLKGIADWFNSNQNKFPKVDPKQEVVFQNSARNGEKDLDFTNIKNVFAAYRYYLDARWKNDKKAPTWKSSAQPDWSKFGR